MTTDCLSSLNPEQHAAATTTDGAVLVLSGAGTGKTTVLTARIAYILEQGLALPWQILALTFTNKAANEMKNRIAAMSDGRWEMRDLWCGTFHSICLRILRFNSQRAGLSRDFLVFGQDEQKTVLKTVFANLGYDPKTYNPGDWVEKISAMKDKGIVPFPKGRGGAEGDGVGVNDSTSTVPPLRGTPSPAHGIYDAYNAELARMNAVDFGDIILKVLRLFQDAPDILEKYRRQFKYIMVDEFQDTNAAQMQFLEMISGRGDGDTAANICCVGDDDQSIYSWRGAEIKHILNFEKTYPGAKIIRLETNYRSTSNILNAANSLIRNNSGRLGKDLRAAPDVGAGEKVYIAALPTDWDEARMIADAIKIANSKYQIANYSNFAVLVRAGSLSRLFEEEFAARGIPYRLVGATKFYDRMEIKDAIAYARLMVHAFDDLSFLRVIAKPRRGFGPGAIAKLAAHGEHFMSAMRAAPLAGKQREAADDFLKAFDFDWESMSPADAVQKLLEDSGYLKMWRDSRETEAAERLDNVRELLTNVISKYDNLSEFLEHAALMMTDDNDAEENPDGRNAVSIMTIHAAKGLEFDTVFMPAWEEGIFPNEMAIGDGGIEEERRLAYVAITRARRRAVISNVLSRMVFGQRVYNAPSRFVGEIDTAYANIQGGETYARPRPQIPTSYKTAARRPRPARVASTVGKLASHAELGRGVIIEDGGDILTIAFRDKGIKKVAREFVQIGDTR
ncbi:MAG: UvrD-helicase domain-containing protein [Rickettsiales bacterium]|jgi:DNA helicase-2/ATP-dependent DNA helicase PcrA|nr:UvrD-helicase domain-containing protein [Rickettsiales bacterium]